MKNWKPIAVCSALVLVGGFALAQDAGFQPPLNSGLNLPVPTGNLAEQRFSTGNAESLTLGAKSPPAAAKSRTDGMTVEEIAAAIETVRVQRAALDQWELELLTAAGNRRVTQWERVSKLGVFVEPPARPARPPLFTFGCIGLFGGE